MLLGQEAPLYLNGVLHQVPIVVRRLVVEVCLWNAGGIGQLGVYHSRMWVLRIVAHWNADRAITYSEIKADTPDERATLV